MHSKTPLYYPLIALFGALGLIGCATHRPLRASFLDVGQGDACVLQLPSGKVCVIDTGGKLTTQNDDMGRRVLLPYLRSQGIQQIDILLLTHPDEDHTGGAETLLKQFPIHTLILNTAEPSPILQTLHTIANERKVSVRYAHAGEWIDFQDGVEMHILAPSPTLFTAKDNNKSLVLQVKYRKTSLLLTGDAEREEEEDLIARKVPLGANLLKVGHHGSHTSTSAEFLTAVHPQIAILSAGKNNRFGHPHPEVVERLSKAHVQTYRTDQHGAITCDSDGESLTCTPYTRLPQ